MTHRDKRVRSAGHGWCSPTFYSSIILDLDLDLAPNCELERYRN
jgi:hypothetical protein